MVMRPDIVDAALSELRASAPQLPLIYLSPRGKVLNQKRCRELAMGPGAILLCGRYEGIDQRVLDAHQAEEVSIGDYILMGGELPAMVLIESCIRLIEGTVNTTASVDEESFETGLLEYPHYTRPANWNGRDVPEILLSGHHAKVQAWRHAQAEEITRERRPDLWDAYVANGHIKEG